MISYARQPLLKLARFALASLFLWATACSSCNETPPDANNTTPPVACQSSAECVGEDAGKLCVEGACVACEEDAQCASDTTYAEAANTCREGICQPCLAGTPGCGCDEDGMCASGECIEDVCVMCARGDLDCVCRNNGTCKAGNQCDEQSNLCVACEPGVQNCPCETDGSCQDGLVCQADVCVPDPCTAGATGCPCDSGSCSSGADYCDEMGVCQECSSDVPGCACAPGDTCEGDNYCDAQTLCQACPEQDKPESCGCTESTECADGLVCDPESFSCRVAITCAALSCGNFVCDDSLEDAVCLEDQCIDGFTFDVDSGVCVEAAPDVCVGSDGIPTEQAIACQMQSKACVDTINGTVCVDTCATLVCSASNRDCVPAASDEEDAACGVCAPGFIEEADANGIVSCVRNGDANCAPPNASSDSIRDLCDARFQLCVSDADGAYCGACSDGRVFDEAQNKCVEIEVCGNSVCGDDEFCFYPQTGGAPSCVARCGEDQAYNEDANGGAGACETCAVQCADGANFPSMVLSTDAAGNPTRVCACEEEVYCAQVSDGTSPRCFESDCEPGEARTVASPTCSACAGLNCLNVVGSSGRTWPIRNAAGDCICETRDGFYFKLGGSSAFECDQDRDGWINQQARTTYENASGGGDVAQLANFRCQLREVDRVRLVNEYGQQRDVALCGGSFYDWDPFDPTSIPTECDTQQKRETVILHESDAIDDDQSMSGQSDFPSYGGRVLRASEVNAMTKACVDANADYNANNVADLLEAQPLKKSDLGNPSATDEEYFFRAFSHFVELHTAYYRPAGLANEPGVYVIAERSRCGGDFPLVYPTGSATSDFYWNACTRSRRGDFDATADAKTGFDFANYHCHEATGTCPLEDLSILATGTDGPDADNIPDHDLCALDSASLLPLVSRNGPWLGMTHHSQFQCVSFQTAEPNPDESHKLGLGNVLSDTTAMGSPQFVANSCDAITSCPDPLDTSCQESTPRTPSTNPDLALIAQPRAPTFHCIEPSSQNPSVAVANDQVGFAAVRYIRPGENSNSLAWANGQYMRGCVDESRGTDGSGFADLYCDGSPTNTNGAGMNQSPANGLRAAGNAGNFGKLICSCQSEYGGSDCSVICAQGPHLGGTDPGADPPSDWACDDSNFCDLYPASPGFAGGRRGFWLCGDTSLTTSSGNVPIREGTDATGKVFKLEGSIEKVPIRRAKMQSDGCANGGVCFEGF